MLDYCKKPWALKVALENNDMPKMLKLIFMILLLLFPACVADKGVDDPSSNAAREQPTKEIIAKEITAREIIEKNLKAVGGAEKIRAIDTLKVHCLSGSALLPATEETTLYLRKPDTMKQESLYRIMLCKDGRISFNAGGTRRTLSKGNIEGVNYRRGFYHNAFSLLNWESCFPSVKLAGKKDYGATSQYVLTFPAAESGRDLIAYIDTKTFLIDRLVYTITQEGAKQLNVVNRLRDYKEYGGILMPTRLVFDKVGWEESPRQFVIRDVEVNPEIDDAIFESDEIDFGELTCTKGSVIGEMRGTSEDTILTNIALEDLAKIGVKELDWVRMTAGDASIEARVLKNIQASARVLKHDEMYLCGYPISGYPRLMIMSLGLVVQEQIPFVQGGKLTVTLLEAKSEGTGETDTNNPSTGDDDE